VTAIEPETNGASLAEIRDSARKERLIDMELRLRRYRAGCFAILALGLFSLAPELGWGWFGPMAVGFAGFAIADRFMRGSAHPEVWVGAAWGMLPLLLGGAVAATGGATSPALMWFALPAVTLGARFEPRGIAIGTAYILAVLLLSTIVSGSAALGDNHHSVVAAVALVLSTVILSGALVESDRAHRHSASIDPLTGLFNRNALELRLAELEGGAGSKPGVSHALLLCDLDHFKRVNDSYGHPTGDEVLRTFAITMFANIRSVDRFGRYGGEEFLLVLPDMPNEGAGRAMDRLRAIVADLDWSAFSPGMKVTLSAGVATLKPNETTDSFLARADTALYTAKAQGRNRIAQA
jgi:diguanylate cyclase (GGDEF)-like protein